MGSFIDITGNRYGKLTVICKSNKKDGKKEIYWHCRCDCGSEIDVRGNSLRCGTTKSCGCNKVNFVIEAHLKHGMSRSKLYNTWCNMKQRCYAVNNIEYKNYGARGIKVCEEWKRSFKSFYEWACTAGYDETANHRKECSLDRIDVNGDYCPENCRWVDMSIQANNKRQTKYLTANGETKPITEWSKESGVCYPTIADRLRRGWSDHDAIFTPPGTVSKSITDARHLLYMGESHTVREWSEILGINNATLKYRLRKGWSIEETLTTPVDVKRRRKEVTT